MTDPGQVHRIVRPQPVAVRTVWPGEATHFTPWLAVNLDWLEPLGLGPLELLGTEVPLPTVGHHAKALVVIAEDHGPEFVAIADYLNRAFEQLGDQSGEPFFSCS